MVAHIRAENSEREAVHEQDKKFTRRISGAILNKPLGFALTTVFRSDDCVSASTPAPRCTESTVSFFHTHLFFDACSLPLFD